jgi:hypothetical protein
MYWTIFTVVAQAAPPLPQTGHPALDYLSYLLGALVSLLGLREGTWWIKTLKEKRTGSNGSRDTEIQWRTAQLQKEMLRELEELRRENREGHHRMETQLAEILRNQRG